MSSGRPLDDLFLLSCVAVIQLDEERKAIDDSIRELRQMQKYLNSINEIVQEEELPVNKKAKTCIGHARAL